MFHRLSIDENEARSSRAHLSLLERLLSKRRARYSTANSRVQTASVQGLGNDENWGYCHTSLGVQDATASIPVQHSVSAPVGSQPNADIHDQESLPTASVAPVQESSNEVAANPFLPPMAAVNEGDLEELIVDTESSRSVINFRCPCGQAHEILICENKCYIQLLPIDSNDMLVWVEDNGSGGSQVHVKCRCMKTFEILVLNGKCYYLLGDC